MGRGNGFMRAWMLRGGMILLGAILVTALLWTFSGSSHHPNHGINMEQAREAANRVNPSPKPDEKRIPGFGG
jgi:hypothetical protein